MSFSLRSSRFRRLAKEGSWIVAGQIAAAAGALMLVRVLTEYLDPEQYGQLALGLTLGTLVCTLPMSGMMPGIARYYTIAAEKGALPGYLKASKRMIGYGTLATLILGSLFVIGAQLMGQGHWLGLIAMTIVFAQLGSYNATLSSIQNAARQRFVVALHSGLDPWLKIVVVVVMFYWLGRSGAVVITGYAIATLVILSSQLFFIRRLIPQHSDDEGGGDSQWVWKIWSYSKPYAGFQMFTWAQVSSDRWALESFTNTQDVGLFAVLMQLGYAPIAMGIGLLTAFVGPILYQRSGDASDHIRNEDVRRISWQLTALCLLITLIAFVLTLGVHEWIFSLLVAPNYRSVSYLLPWVLLAGGLFAAGQVLSLKLMSDMNTSALLWPKVTTSIVGICLNFIGAYYAGLHGIIIAAIAFALLHLIWLALLAVRIPRPY